MFGNHVSKVSINLQYKAVLGVLLRARQPSALAGGMLRQQLPVVPECGRGGAPLAVPGAAAAAPRALHRARRGPTHHAHHIRGQVSTILHNHY